MSKTKFKTVLLILPIFLLCTACTMSRESLGVSQGEWQGYSKNEQQQLLSNFHQIKAEQEQTNFKTNNWLRVKVYGGTMYMEPSFGDFSYAPLNFSIREGSCVSKKASARENPDETTTLTLCYRNGILYLDPSRFDLDKAYGTITLHKSPFWEDGFSYHNLSSKGFAKLRSVSVGVKSFVKDIEKTQDENR